MKRLGFFRGDLLLLFRRGIIPAYLVMLALYLVLLFFLPPALRPRVAALLVFTDTGALGFFFVGAAVQWEKRERVYEALFVTPFTPGGFLLIRATALTAVSLAVSLALIAAGLGPGISAAGLLTAGGGAAMGALFFTFFGTIVAVITRGVNSYFMTAVALFIPFAVPFATLAGLWWNDMLLLLPSGAMVQLLSSGLGGLDTLNGDPGRPGLVPFSIVSLVLWNLAAWLSARRLFIRRITVESGADQ